MILMFVMAAVPFTFAMRWRPAFATRFYEGMKRSENFRKFFTLVILMVMIALEFICLGNIRMCFVGLCGAVGCALLRSPACFSGFDAY